MVTFTQSGRTMYVFASLKGLTDGPTRLVVTSTVGNEMVPCNEAGGQATCSGTLIGDPLISGVGLLANNGKVLSKGTIASVPAFLVTNILLDKSTVAAGGVANITFTGSNLTSQTFFDVRFAGPLSSTYIVAENWQTGDFGSHIIPAGTPTGAWTINGVRPHQDPLDHTGGFFPVSATITVQ